MQLADVQHVVKDVPWMNRVKSRRMWDFLMQHQPQQCLELGFCHGVSSVYIAAALEQLGRGHLTTVDLHSARTLEPNIHQLLDKTGLSHRVTPYFEPISYTWRLMHLLEDEPTPQFDFCYLDGAHTWDDTGFAFFLVERLLRPGGHVIFDDLTWTFHRSPTLGRSRRVQKMTVEQRETPQVGKVFDLLVRHHPRFTACRVEGDWGYAQKKLAD